MKTFTCKDIDGTCDYKVTGETNDEILRKAEEHGRTAHGMKDFPKELRDQVVSKIRDVKAA